MTVTRRAGPVDEAVLLVLIEEFCAIDRHDFDRNRVLRGLTPLLAGDDVGQVWLVEGEPGAVDGYAVVTWSWSLESGGRDCLLDELYVRRRGEGLGGRALREVLAAAAGAVAAAMFLETESHNARVRAFYRRAGFEVESSVWMARPLTP